MFKINKFISFWVRSEGLMTVIDTLSVFGTVRVRRTKAAKGYIVGLYCEPDMVERCFDNILMMSEDGITIRKLNIRYRE